MEYAVADHVYVEAAIEYQIEAKHDVIKSAGKHQSKREKGESR
jgi:hypothetical protein